MICLDLDDKIMERARINRIGKYTRIGTNTVLWSGFGVLIVSGTVGIAFLGELLIIGIVNKGTKWIIKNRKRLIHITN
jgi:hypothetical protein